MNEDTNDDPTRLTRRESLAKLGGLAATAFGATAWGLESAAGSDSASGPAGVTSGLVRCVLTPEQTAGPYFLEGDQVRRDIRAGRPGVPLTLRALRARRLDVQANQRGGRRYLAFRCARRLLGRCGPKNRREALPPWNPADECQRACDLQDDLSGVVSRPDRAHPRPVYLGGSVIHTGQMYFPEKVTDAVFKRSAYRRRPNRDTRNANDFVYRSGGRRSLLTMRRSGAGYIGEITMGVSR